MKLPELPSAYVVFDQLPPYALWVEKEVKAYGKACATAALQEAAKELHDSEMHTAGYVVRMIEIEEE